MLSLVLEKVRKLQDETQNDNSTKKMPVISSLMTSEVVEYSTRSSILGLVVEQLVSKFLGHAYQSNFLIPCVNL